MEKKTKRVRLSSKPEDVTNTDEEVFNINSLPVEIFLQIFGNLNYQDLCRSGRVCKKWHEVAKCHVFWKKVDIQFSHKKGLMSEAANKFIGALPVCLTHLRMEFEHSRDGALDITELSKKLQTNCPNLEVLIFQRARSPGSINLVFYLGEEHFANIRVLVFHNFFANGSIVLFDFNKHSITLKIEVLDISLCHGVLFTGFFRSNLPHLKQLRLARTGMPTRTGNLNKDIDIFFQEDPLLVSQLEVIDIGCTDAGSMVFKTIRDYGCNLVELYMCFNYVNDDDFIFDDSNNLLPFLKIICLRGSNVTHKGVSSLVKSCQSLQHVYVGNREYSNDFAKCNSKKVQFIHGIKYCDHYAKVDYMRM